MAFVTKSSSSLSVTAYVGDAKTLLAFNLLDKKSIRNRDTSTTITRCRRSIRR